MIPMAGTRDALYKKLLIADVRRQLPGEPLDADPVLTPDEIRRLLIRASVLALAPDPASKTVAYEISTRLVEVLGDANPRALLATDSILSRIGNFPGRGLLRGRYQVPPTKPPYSALEAIAREAENSAEGVERPLTDFQIRLYRAIAGAKATSVSAPTSAGKSYVLALDIVRRIQAERLTSVVYVVPTRALIRQVMLKVSQELNKAGLRETAVRCVPLPVTREQAPAGIVYVLTQERLMSLLHSDEGDAWITTLVVDEAQGIKDGARGIILQTAIDTVLARGMGADIIFASPLSKNPDYLLELFQRHQGSAHFIEQHSPVSQNRILVESSRKKAQFTMLNDNAPIDLGRRDVEGLRFSGSVHERRAQLAIKVTEPGTCSIIYENGPSAAEDTATAIVAALEGEPDTDDPEILEFIDFLGEHIHEQYPLIGFLKKRVAFHFSEMPPIVRSRLEDMFADNKLRYIACTSTLLQGVNLPAKNIIIEKPTKGSGKKMEKADFENLAGRAGRLLHEFHGNIWCVRPSQWENDCLYGDRLQEISSAFSNVFRDGGTLLRKALHGEKIADVRDQELAVAALGKLFAEYIVPKKDLRDASFWNPDRAGDITMLSQECQQVQIHLHPSILSRNSTISPVKLEALYSLLKSKVDPTAWIPLAWNREGSYQRMVDIFQVIWSELEGQTNRSYQYHANLAWQWIRDVPLRRMIDEKIRRMQEAPADAAIVGKAIRLLMHDIETLLRYRYVKGLKAYNDVLRFVLLEAGHNELAERLIPLHLFLECGASDTVALGLISIGLSRTTALLLKNHITFPDDATPEACKAILREADLDNRTLPPLCRREVVEIIGD